MSTKPSSYASGPSETPLLGATIGEQLVQTTELFGEREALVDVPSGRRWTYHELDEDVDRLASGLLQLGVQKAGRLQSREWSAWTGRTPS